MVPWKKVFIPVVNLQSWSASFPQSCKSVELFHEEVLGGEDGEQLPVPGLLARENFSGSSS